ncbi:MAG: GEVED domain-containing protein [Candidatus Eisenbacteria bacterium]
MARKCTFVFLIVLLAYTAAAFADWDLWDARKWAQLPDLDSTGIDVNASGTLILADDFRCTEAGPITEIHIWASWLHNYLPFGDSPDSVRFILSIHGDIPESLSTTGYSMPDTVLWSKLYPPGSFSTRVWKDSILEGWLNPPDGYYEFPADTVCWQYNFSIPPIQQFYQEGRVDSPVVYWLNVKAKPRDQAASLGWKTSVNHWNDDAVWGEGAEPYDGPWYELTYPDGHDMEGQSIDLAFVIVGQDEGAVTDWGDAPDDAAVPGYPTLAVNGGAAHGVGGPWLGDLLDAPDMEMDGQPDPNALGDDINGYDDEDGVQIPTLTPGEPATITFRTNGGNGWVVGWIDFNADQIWQPSEKVYSAFVAPGVHSFNLITPTASVTGETFARFRISTAGGLPPGGAAADGEVEDHKVLIEEAHTYKWIQRPDLTSTGIDVECTTPYLLADDFQCGETGKIVLIDVWGSWQDDVLPFGVDPTAVTFTLSIHEDIPESVSSTGFSMPGDTLWIHEFRPGDFVAYIWKDGLFEGWMEPPDIWVFPGDFTCWLYRFVVPGDSAFLQTGTEDDSITYWLDVQAVSEDPFSRWGWKTSVDHWNDDAVWATGMEPHPGPWEELIYPPGHAYVGQSIDLAFRLRMDPGGGVHGGDHPQGGIWLGQNAPNPFASATTLRYALPPGGGHVKLEIYTVTGQLVTTLVDQVQEGGPHSVSWSGTDRRGRNMAAGIYFQRLTLDSQVATGKVMLVR